MRNIRLRTSLTHQLAPLFRKVSSVHNAQLKPLELKAVEAHIWGLLRAEGPLSVGELQAELGIKGSTLTGALDRLEQRGLLRRELSAGDRRSFTLSAVKAPAKLERGLEAALDEAEQRCWGQLTAAERKTLHRLLEKANRQLEV